MARQICTIVENNSQKQTSMELKENIRTYDYPEKMLKLEYKKDQILQKEICQPKTI